MIRLIVRTSDVSAAAHVGGPVEVSYRTFDIEHPEIEAHLRAQEKFRHIELIGAEVLPADSGEGGAT